MISWIQKTFQQHFRTIFLVLLALIIISFVAFTPGVSGRADRKVADRPFFGLNLSAREDAERLGRDASLSIELQAGYSALSGDQLEEYALTRYAAVALANDLNIPAPAQTELTEHIKKMRAFAGQDGQFDAKRYDEFRKNLKSNPRLTEADIGRVLSDDLRVERMRKLVSGPGYVLPFDVKKELERADTSWTVALASIDRTSFTPAITPSETEITKFFEDNPSRYQIPARVTVSYAEFPASAFVNAVTVSEAEVKAFYDANPARFPKPTDKLGDANKPQLNLPQAPANAAADYAIVRPQVEAALKLERASRYSAEAANKLALTLFDRKVAADSGEFAAAIADSKAVLKNAPPFSAESVPAELGRNPQIAEEAFKLSKERYYSDAIPTENGSVVLFWKNSEPARTPLLTEVRAKVAADYVEEEKRRRFFELGKTLRTQIAAKVKAGETFEKAANAAAAASGVKVEVKTPAAFTLRQPPQDLDGSVYGVLENLKKGDVSDMTLGSDKGVVVYVVDKKVPEMTDANPQFASVRTRLSQQIADFGSREHFRSLVAAELAKSAPPSAAATP